MEKEIIEYLTKEELKFISETDSEGSLHYIVTIEEYLDKKRITLEKRIEFPPNQKIEEKMLEIEIPN